MGLIQILTQLQNDPKSVWWFIQGYTRWFFAEKLCWTFLFSKEFLKEVERRKELAAECAENGSCYCCGCDTPQLFYSNPGCKKDKFPNDLEGCKGDPCYPPIKKLK